jgi:predicted Zn finger-like uncharacterized protein
MSDITRCPECETRFKVSEEQLAAHEGLVRCGRCQHVFNAREHLQAEEPSPQLNLPIEEPSAATEDTVADTGVPAIDEVAAPDTELIGPAADAEAAPREATEPEPDESGNSNTGEEPVIDGEPGQPDLRPIPNLSELEEAPATLAQQVRFVEDAAEDLAPPAPVTRKRKTAALFAALLILLLLAQGIYFLRHTLAAKLPGLKPMLNGYCALLSCTVDLPREVDALSIESSELEADAKLVNVITLHALLRNRSGHTQAWPSLELTLTDLRDQVIARRAFHPTDYLRDKEALQKGIGRNREQEIALRLDTSDLRPSGYRLLLFYPRH